MSTDTRWKALCLSMLKTLEQLSLDRYARVDARAWHAHYQRRIKRKRTTKPTRAI